MLFRRMRPAILALGVTLAFAGCEPTSVNTPQSIASESAQAEQLVYELRSKGALMENDAVDRYVAGIVQRLDAARGRGSVPIRSHVVKDADVNAFTPGGGHLFVNAGLIAAMQNEAQLATVVAHEIGHIDRGHIQAGQARRGAVGLGAAAALIGGAMLGLDPQLTEFGVDLGAQYAMSSFTREQERDADLTAGRYLASAGYNVAEGANSFGVLRQIAGGPGGGFLSTHPPTGERQQAMLASASELGATSGRTGKSEHDTATRKLREELLQFYRQNNRMREAAVIGANLAN